MSSTVAPAMVISDPAQIPITAISSTGSKGSMKEVVRAAPRLRWGVADVADRRRGCGGRGHQRVADVPGVYLIGRLNHFDSMVLTTGAAATAPKPPFSTVATTTIGRVLSGT